MAEERQAYNEINPWWGEHIHRYEVVKPFITRNAKILDLACGNGFGSYKLSLSTNNKVVGGDVDDKAIHFCKSNFKNINLTYQIIDGTNIPFGNNSFDILTSFETIEHSKEYNSILSEFYRVLKPGGYLFISTPNIVVNSPDMIIKNKYHTQEFNFDELNDIINQFNFEKIKFYGQKYIRYENSSFKNKIFSNIEKVLYKRGVRKIPIMVKDTLTKLFINKPHYPISSDYELVNEKSDIVKCKTFYLICQK